ncbi:hypothetical protein CYMTET_29186 [Cymbomonas tetramitiformis]|uniref:Uncharacterized protein n=1 Tax=Cymbomonas tetramitiformis TaxID=36881 RepID=A0AAE0FLB5_9CHLO|nr:hypothetical protein CYMTET_29186 [Cymbomonas tetramitiformis]
MQVKGAHNQGAWTALKVYERRKSAAGDRSGAEWELDEDPLIPQTQGVTAVWERRSRRWLASAEPGKMEEVTCEWTVGPAMSHSRANCAAVVHGQYIYAIGGCDDSAALETVERLDTSTGLWETRGSMVVKRFNCAVVAHEGYIYALGGCDDGGPLHSVERMDVATGQWEIVGHMSTKRHRCAAMLHGQRVHVMGGSDGRRSLRDMECLDVATGQWETAQWTHPRGAGESADDPLCSCTLVVEGRHIYAIATGAMDAPNAARFGELEVGKTVQGTVERLDQSTGQWERLSSMASWRQACAVVAQGRHIYAIGGWSGWNELATVQRLDVSTGQWQAVASMHAKRAACAAVVHEQRLYVIGGITGGSCVSSVECSDISAGPWEVLGSMVSSRRGCAAVVQGAFIYVIGGCDSRSCLETVERMEVATQQWEVVGSMSSNRRGCAAVAHGDHIYVVGGNDGRGCLETAERMDMSTGQWEHVAHMTTKRDRCAAVVYGKHIYVLGGISGPQSILDTVERMDLSTGGGWEAVASMGTRREGCAAVVKGQHIYVIGGCDGRNELATAERMDVSTGQWESVGNLGTERWRCAAVAHGERIFAVGGHDGQSELATVEQLDPATGRWQALGSPLSAGRWGCAATMHGQHLYVIGGHDGENELATVERLAVSDAIRAGGPAAREGCAEYARENEEESAHEEESALSLVELNRWYHQVRSLRTDLVPEARLPAGLSHLLSELRQYVQLAPLMDPTTDHFDCIFGDGGAICWLQTRWRAAQLAVRTAAAAECTEGREPPSPALQEAVKARDEVHGEYQGALDENLRTWAKLLSADHITARIFLLRKKVDRLQSTIEGVASSGDVSTFDDVASEVEAAGVPLHSAAERHFVASPVQRVGADQGRSRQRH